MKSFLLVLLASVAAAASPAYSNAWANVRGVNYVPSYSANPVQTWYDYNETTVERELGYAQSIGLNAVRVFSSVFVWYANPAGFLASYDHLVAACAARGIKPFVVLFDDDFFDVKGVNTTSQIEAWLKTGEYKSLKWMANPGMKILAEDAKQDWKLMKQYVAAMAGGKRKNDARILGYDLMNEPHRKTTAWPGGLQVFITAMLKATAATTDVLTTLDDYQMDPKNLYSEELALSSHHYWNYGKWPLCSHNTTQVCVDQKQAIMPQRRTAEKLNKPLLVSETGQFDCYCPSAKGFMSAGVGWIAWELMLEHDQFSSFQGMVYKNGTFRSSSEAACLKALSSATTTSFC